MTLSLAMILDALLGEPDWLWSRVPHPAVLMGRAVSVLDRSLNRGPHRKVKGCIAVLCLIVGAVVIGTLLAGLGPVVEVLVCAILLAQRSLVEHVRDVSDALRQNLQGGRHFVGRIVSRNTDEMTEPDVARAAIESASENLSDGVVAPVFWFMVGGLPGLLLYKAINTADSMIGYRTPRYLDFGWAAARCDDLLNLIPARATAGLIALLGRKIAAWRQIAQDAANHRSPNAGWPEAAMARTLDIALAGPRRYDGTLQELAWVNGSANRAIGAAEVDRAVAVLWRVWAVLLGLSLLYSAIVFLG